MRWLRFFENLLFPPRCVSCHGLMQKDLLDPCECPLCDKCRLEWEREKGEDCPDCGREMVLCRCYPPRMKKAGISEAIKLINYRSDRETAGRRAILYLKKHLNSRGFDFFAKQLSYPVKKHMDQNGLTSKDVAFCYVPRGEKNAAEFGLDQSEQLCRRLAACCGARFLPLLYRTGKRSAEQKKLSGKMRERNAENRFAVDGKVLTDLAGVKCLFLVDDIITTGASLRSCAKAVSPVFDGTLVAVALARTPLRRRTAYVGRKIPRI